MRGTDVMEGKGGILGEAAFWISAEQRKVFLFPVQKVIPEVLQMNRGAVKTSCPQHRHHLSKGAYPFSMTAGAGENIADKFREPLVIGPSVYHELCQRLLRIQRNVLIP